MFKRLIQWLKKFLKHFFGSKQNFTQHREEVVQQAAPHLSNTDLEFLFTELLEGVHQAKGQAWAQKWLDNLEHRVSTERWLVWLNQFGERLLASSKPHNEIAGRLIQLGELGVGNISNLAYDIGMKILIGKQRQPILEYNGPDAIGYPASHPVKTEENLPEGEYKTVTLDELFMMLQQDQTLCQQIAQQLGIETDHPEEIIQALLNEYNETNQSSDELPAI